MFIYQFIRRWIFMWKLNRKYRLLLWFQLLALWCTKKQAIGLPFLFNFRNYRVMIGQRFNSFRFKLNTLLY